MAGGIEVRTSCSNAGLLGFAFGIPTCYKFQPDARMEKRILQDREEPMYHRVFGNLLGDDSKGLSMAGITPTM